MHTSVKIIASIPDDVYRIREIQRIVWLDIYPNKKAGITREDIELKFRNDNTKEGRGVIEKKKEKYDNPNIHILVAKEDEIIIGFIIASKENENRINAIYILPEFQGQGIGRSLMSQALDWLGAEKDIYLNVASYNNQAIGFYEKFSFVKTDREGALDNAAKLPSGKIIPEVEMIRQSHKAIKFVAS